MRKSSTAVTLVIISAALVSCAQKKPFDPNHKNVYMRGDSTAPYGNAGLHHSHFNTWYYAFRPYGTYDGGSYHHSGYYSGGISEHANVGSSAGKSSVVRGGFGSSGHGFSVSS